MSLATPVSACHTRPPGPSKFSLGVPGGPRDSPGWVCGQRILIPLLWHALPFSSLALSLRRSDGGQACWHLSSPWGPDSLQGAPPAPWPPLPRHSGKPEPVSLRNNVLSSSWNHLIKSLPSNKPLEHPVWWNGMCKLLLLQTTIHGCLTSSCKLYPGRTVLIWNNWQTMAFFVFLSSDLVFGRRSYASLSLQGQWPIPQW